MTTSRGNLYQALLSTNWVLMRRFILLLAAGLILSTAHAQDQQVPTSTVPPAYPLAAKAKGMEGTVILKGIIDETGAVHDLQVVSGPAELRQAAINAVAQWKYHPYLRNGKPTPVDTTIVVNFKLGDKKQKAAAMAKAQAELAQQSLAN